MQKIILNHKKEITILNGLLIILAVMDHFFLTHGNLAGKALFIAGILGLLPVFVQAYQSLKIKVVSIDVLVTIAVLGAFFVKSYEEAAVVTFLFLAGHFLEQATISKTRKAIKSLTDMAPESSLRKNSSGEFEVVAVDDIEKGDILLVKTGDKMPVDGQVIKGSGYANEASITGESKEVVKKIGATVSAGTILENGTLQIQAERVGEDTTFGKIIELVEEAQDSKSDAERFIDKFSKYYTPAVLLLGLIVGIVSKDVKLAVTILVLGCPGALVIGIPVSNVAGIGNGAKHGILLKGSETIQNFGKTDTIIFDKTGTLTQGNPSVSEVLFLSEIREEILSELVSIEAESDHPLAKAILSKFPNQKRKLVSETKTIKGGGVSARINHQQIFVGNLHLMQTQKIPLTTATLNKIEQLEQTGNSIVLMARNQKLVLVMGIKDQIRKGVKEDLNALKKLGVQNLVLLSGDNQGTVDIVASQLEMTQAYGNMLPADKANAIKKAQDKGHNVTFVGDGVNDSPSLANANTGIAMGSGTDVAIETSDIVLMNSEFNRLVQALTLAKATTRNMKQNIFIAVGVVVFLLLSVLFSNWISMGIGMFVHEASILVVILNAIRLLNHPLR